VDVSSLQRVGGVSDVKPTQATLLVELVESEPAPELFHSPEGVAYATIPVPPGWETWPLRSRQVRSLMARLYYQAVGAAPGSQAIQDAISTLEGKALFAGEELPVYVRVASHEGNVYVDLGSDPWRTVEVRPDGWEVIERAPVKFRRPRGLAEMPLPSAEGDLGRLREFVNVDSGDDSGDDSDWRLLVGWLVGAFHPSGPYPVLSLRGEQGSAKSTTARVLRTLVDPSAMPLRSPPRNIHDLMIAASNSWAIVLDNVSELSDWLSDSLCRLSTGGGLATRQLYSDTDEIILAATRPQLLTGIDEVIHRGDLLDRSILLDLPRIAPGKRQPEQAFWAQFAAAQPVILGGLFDAVSAALANRDKTKLKELPRMADFGLWVTAAEPALGWKPGSFLAAYTGNVARAHEVALDASPVGPTLRAFVSTNGGFEGTFADLLTRLTAAASEQAVKARTWPSAPRALSSEVRRLAPNLRALGLDVQLPEGSKVKGQRILTIKVAGQAGRKEHG
jgi:hypothetical protein